MSFDPARFSVFNMTLPESPLVVPQNIDLRTAANASVDFSQLVDAGQLDYISGAYIDNSENSLQLVIGVAGTNQTVKVAPGTQGYYPLLAPNNPKFEISCATSPGLVIPVLFYNVPLLPYNFNVNNSNGGASGPAMTGRSIAALAAGDQVLAGAGAAAQYLLVQNDSAINTIAINIAGADSTVAGIIVQPGGSYELGNGTASAIHISGTAGQPVTAFTGA